MTNGLVRAAQEHRRTHHRNRLGGRPPRRVSALLLVVAVLGLPAVAGPSPASAEGDRALVLDATVTGGSASIEATEAVAQGLTVDIVDATTWTSMTAADFSAYRLIILGDPTCGSLGAAQVAAASNATTWGPVIDGNIVITGTDPVYHAGQGGEVLTRRAIDFAMAQPAKTGAYISLSCYYHDTEAATAVPLLDGIGSGGFTVGGVGCFNNAHIVAESPALAGLTDADLSGWSCSVHEAFESWPAGLIPLAIAKDFDSSYTSSDGTQGPPYILAGGDIRSFPLSLSPLRADASTGATHSVTAELLDGATRAPVVGARISFRVESGPNVGAAGSCAPVTCTTNTDGKVTWQYQSAGTDGTDAIRGFFDVDADGSLELGEPQTTAGVTWVRSSGFKYVALGDSFSAGEGITPFLEPTNKCHRSASAYPFFVERPGMPRTRIRDLAQVGGGVQWGFQPCSGATTDAVQSVGWHSDPLPQLAMDRSTDVGNASDLPVDGDTDLVTITIGGNNVGFSDILQFCAYSNDCTTEKYQGRTLEQVVTSRLDALGPKLESTYRQIRAQAPQAAIAVAGYPQLFPQSADEQNCGKISQKNYLRKDGVLFEWRSIGFSQPEQNFLRGQTSRLNQTIADRVIRSGVAHFIPVDAIFAGHEICGDDGEWINSPTIVFSEKKFKANDHSFHPNALGQRDGYAAAINLVLNPPLPEF